jgi:transposase
MIESSARLGRHRWTIERTGAWLGGFRRLRIRYERCSGGHLRQALIEMGEGHRWACAVGQPARRISDRLGRRHDPTLAGACAPSQVSL